MTEEPPPLFEDKYIVVGSNGTTPAWFNRPNYGADSLPDVRPKIIFGDMVLAYEYAYGEGSMFNETLKLVGTTSTLAGEETVFASREFDSSTGEIGADFHRGGLYVYGDRVAALGGNSVWEVDAAGVSTIVPIPIALLEATFQAVPTNYVDNGNQRSLRAYIYWLALYGPEDAVLWAVPPVGFATTPVWHGLTAMDNQESPFYEDLEGDPPEERTARLDGTMSTAWGTEPGMYFNWEFDPEIEGYNLEAGQPGSLPPEFWQGSTFHYLWKAGWPSAGISGGGTVVTRLQANYEGSAGPIAGDGLGEELAVSVNGPGLGQIGWEARKGDAFYWLSLSFYVSPTSGPGGYANLSAGIEEAWIEGGWTQIYDQPWRQTWARSEYEFTPASDMDVVTPDRSAWGAPAHGGGTVKPRSNWWRAPTRFLTAVVAQTEQTHYPMHGPSDIGSRFEPYDVNAFTIALRWDEPAASTITNELDLSRTRFTGIRP